VKWLRKLFGGKDLNPVWRAFRQAGREALSQLADEELSELAEAVLAELRERWRNSTGENQ